MTQLTHHTPRQPCPPDYLNQAGLASLFMVVVIGLAALLISRTAIMLGLGELELGVTSQAGTKALAVAEGCLEETLERMRKNNQYGIGAGPINLGVGTGNCTINVTDLGSQQRQIQIIGTHDRYNKETETVVDLSGNQVTIVNWRET